MSKCATMRAPVTGKEEAKAGVADAAPRPAKRSAPRKVLR
jgi:hypothetical protein